MAVIKVVVGGQFGSEAKGACAAFLLDEYESNPASVRIGGPNAGHTVYDYDERRWPLRTIPVGAALYNKNIPLVIAQGSEIELDVLWSEVDSLNEAGHQVDGRLFIDGEITIIDPEHKEQEAALIGRIGSTGKGIGAARAARMLREARRWRDLTDEERRGLPATDTFGFLAEHMRAGQDVVIEGTQGYGLGLHAGHYPKCTTNNARAIDCIAQTGLSPWAPYVDDVEVWVVARTYPIRVAGNSGELKNETSWEELGLQPEKTTVTQKIRRVGLWDEDLVAEAVEANGENVNLMITMLDQMWPELSDEDELNDEAWEFIERIQKRTGVHVGLVGTGVQSHFRI